MATPTENLVNRLKEAEIARDFGPERVKALLTEVLKEDGDWLDQRYQQRPDDQDWMLYPLYRATDRRCSMLVAVFKPGVSAPIHDHGSWAVIGVYRGRERETWFRRAVHTERPGERLEVVRTFVNDTGTVGVVPKTMIHTVAALDGANAVSIHVYGTDIVTQRRSTYDPETGRETIFQPDFSTL